MEEEFRKHKLSYAISMILVCTLTTILAPPTTAWSNGAAPDGIGDFFNHHVYFYSTGALQDDISASRAQEKMILEEVVEQECH